MVVSLDEEEELEFSLLCPVPHGGGLPIPGLERAGLLRFQPVTPIFFLLRLFFCWRRATVVVQSHRVC